MSFGEYATLDHLSTMSSIVWHIDRVPSKRKLEDYDPDEDSPHLTAQSQFIPPRTRKENFETASSSSYASSSSCASFVSKKSVSNLHFFVRMISSGHSVVIHANSDDTVESVHETIREMTGIPMMEQSLVYLGKQLVWDRTLSDCRVANDSWLHLVGRMRSTDYPRPWQLLNDVIYAVCCLCDANLRDGRIFDYHAFSNVIRCRIIDFLKITPREDSEMTLGHLQVFNFAGGPSALVKLYLSPFEGNRECAEDTIRLFLTSNIDFLPKFVHTHCASIVLEFCKFLSRSASGSSLYLSCRTSLGLLLETIGTAHGSLYFNYAKSTVISCELYPFVAELAVPVLSGLESSLSSPSVSAVMAADVTEFTAFLPPLLRAIEDRLGEERPNFGKGPTWCKSPHFEYEIVSLHTLFIELLVKVDKCLAKVETYLAKNGMTESGRHCIGWAQYLSIIKELNAISKLYVGEEERFTSILRSRQFALNVIIKQASRNEGLLWLLLHKDVTNFESRRHLVMMMFPEVKDDYDELHEMLIDRSQLLEESFEYIGRASHESLQGGLFMEFKNEEATGPGVLREWFSLVCQALFNPQNGLFLSCANDRRRFFPNPGSGVNRLHLDYFGFCGRLIALALMHKVQVGIVFDRVFFLQLAGKHISLEDIRDADPCLYMSCKKLLEFDADVVDSDTLGLTFVSEIVELGSHRVEELCPGGKGISVDSRNRQEYVNLLIQHRFVTSVSQQVMRWAQGFGDILCNSNLQKYFFQSLDLEDLDRMLYGNERDISVMDWKTHTEYNGYKQTDHQICWFWKIVEGMSSEQRQRLLYFWTSVSHLPVEGFGGLGSRLHIYKSIESHHRLPTAHTCFYRLCLPQYQSISVMQDRLSIITQEYVTCSFGMW